MYVMREGLVEDREALYRFLGEDKKRKEGGSISPFFLVCHDDQVIGTIGYEQVEKNCLLKTFVFSATVDKMVFIKFFSYVLSLLRQKEINCVYLVTKGSATIHFFEEFGFISIEEYDLPESIQEIEHYQAAKQQKNSLLLVCDLCTNISTV
ncbi:GNAT family N-acetyltransferase [Priestia taiwanensis]|uniref:N-acetyltransferase domain-containing protein n=1 Tax=Priestia taiwanensis TaxID=1347902 RepID=A0A917ERM4_9BACI|nr:hypothetical protein [Priestia taiwanensis]MBM7364985.1 N-acetylglutamate synthase-like GNAT family acetyltransferase [Priestia taiwanensis]GGE81995.1 hypothetical protein GCM10007140_34560 [Priestia taiwanensis]